MFIRHQKVRLVNGMIILPYKVGEKLINIVSCEPVEPVAPQEAVAPKVESQSLPRLSTVDFDGRRCYSQVETGCFHGCCCCSQG